MLVIFRIFLTKPLYQNGDNLRITSLVLEEPVRYPKYQSLSIANLKVYLPTFPEINYGDKVTIEGKVNDGKLTNSKLIRIEEKKNLLFNLRLKIISFYRKVLPEPSASLVAGIVLGSKSQIPDSFWTNLKSSGTAHVVVASGMNVAFVGGFLISFLTVYLSRKKAIIFSLLGIWLYALFAGFEAPIIRAAIMTSLAFWAQSEGKLSFSWTILCLTSLVMLIINPAWIKDTGFILTFTATASIMLFQGRVDKLLKRVPEFIRKDLSTTLSAQIGVTPILFVTFGQFNPLSPIINVLILWTVPLIMTIGVISGIVSLFFEPLGSLILYLAYPLTWWFTTLVKVFS